MIASSRPIRFLVTALGGWIAVRAVLLWPPVPGLPDLVRSFAPVATAQAATVAAPPSIVSRPPFAAETRAMRYGPSALTPRAIGQATGIAAASRRGVTDPTLVALALAGMVRFGPATPVATPGSDPPPAFAASRFSGSAWAIVRPGGRATPFASQLGGSQAGVRLAYAIDPARRLALTARFSAALESRQREASIGIDWRPTRWPVHLVAEQRLALDGGRGGPAAGAIGGIGPTPVGGGFRLEAYGQAGVIARDGAEGFADGSARVTHRVAARDRFTVDVGGGAWGGAQRDAARLDIGPTLGATAPIGERSLRVSLDWRQRIAGTARPDSGPALSLGIDF